MDAHIYSGYRVPPHYDSMIGKLICWGNSREDAIARMKCALSEMIILGIDTNIALQSRIMDDQVYAKGTHHIHYLADMLDAWTAE